MRLLLLGSVVACSHAPPAATDGAGSDTGAESGDTGAPTDWADAWDCTPNDAVSWGGFADGFFSAYCRACHSLQTPDRRGAPEGVNFGTRLDALDFAERLKVRVLDEETMPLGGGVVEDDRVRFEGWLCSQVQRGGP